MLRGRVRGRLTTLALQATTLFSLQYIYNLYRGGAEREIERVCAFCLIGSMPRLLWKVTHALHNDKLTGSCLSFISFVYIVLRNVVREGGAFI